MRPKPGTKIRILKTRGHSNLSPGDVAEVAHDPEVPTWTEADASGESFDWVKTLPGGYGWVTWEVVSDPLRARLSRQRHELRRLNHQCRLVRLERDRAVTHLDLAMKALLQTREELAVCRLMKSSTS